MCCLFTIFGWLIDSIQRVWVFVMSCCVSSAICCLILTACTSGIALGYNYSLAEYIDLKETNVSVFIKRGVFDDEIAEEDGEMRRVGGGPAAGVGADMNLRRDAGNTNNMAAQSARRLDDSIVESDNQNKFESSLLKLTAKPPYLPPTTTTAFKDVAKMEELVSNFPPGSLDQMKAMQAVINARRAGMLPDVRRNQGVDQGVNSGINPGGIQGPHTTDQYDEKIKFMNNLLSGRKFQADQNDIVMPSNALRDAVPRMDLSGWPKDAVPKYTQNMNFFGSNDVDYEFGHPPSFPPRPPLPSPSRIRPSTLATMKVPQRTEERLGQLSRTPPTRETPKAVKAFKEDLDKYKQRLLINQYDEPNLKAEDFPRRKPDEDDYEEEFKGAPVRKKRDADDYFMLQLFDYTISDINVETYLDDLLTTEASQTTEFVQITESIRTSDSPQTTASLQTIESLKFEGNPPYESNNISNAVSTSNNTKIDGDINHLDQSVESNREVTTESMMKHFNDHHHSKKLFKYKNRKIKLKVIKEKNAVRKWTRRKINLKKSDPPKFSTDHKSKSVRSENVDKVVSLGSNNLIKRSATVLAAKPIDDNTLDESETFAITEPQESSAIFNVSEVILDTTVDIK